MLISVIQRLFNTALAGETLTYNEMVVYLDKAIDGINDKLNTCFPVFSDIEGPIAADTVYDYFPDKYIRSVVIPGAAWYFYTMDEEGVATAQQYQLEYEQGKFLMLRDLTYSIPDEYRLDGEQGFLIGNKSNDTLGDRGIVLDLDY